MSSKAGGLLKSQMLIVIVAVLSAGPDAIRAQKLSPRASPSKNAPGLARSESESDQAATSPHPLDEALKLAYEMRDEMRQNVKDYTATLVKRERINGVLTDNQFISLKIRNRVVEGKKLITPLSVYLRFVKPKGVEGREVIWVEGQNDGRLLAHEGGFKNLLTVRLDPKGSLAMVGQRYPIYEIGIANLNDKLIEKGERDRARGECDVKFFRNAKVNDRACTMIRVTHPEKRPYFDFHIAEVFIDNELNVPIRYVAHTWPTTRGGEPLLDEEYTYQKLQLNVGLSNTDFDPENSNYRFR